MKKIKTLRNTVYAIAFLMNTNIAFAANDY